MTVIGTAYRLPPDLAIRAQLDGLAASAATVHVLWAFRDAALLDIARAAASRLGLALVPVP